MTTFALFAIVAMAQPSTGARLLISGPFVAGGQTYNEIHQFDLESGERTTLRSFPSHPSAIAMGPDGVLYVAMDAEARIYKLNSLTGETVGILDIPLAPQSYFLDIAVKPNGNLLIVSRDTAGSGLDQVDEYGADGTHQSLWLGPTYTTGGIKLTPNGKVALFCCGHPGYEPNELVEYDLDGSNPRVVIDSAMGVRMYSFVFASPTEVLVVDRGSDPYASQESIKRYDWTTTPATYLGDLVPSPAPISLWIARNAQDGSLFGAGPHLGGDGCVYGWTSDGTPLNDGQPFPTCYGPGPLYAGPVLVINDCGNLADCNGNFVSDDCDIADGTSQDCNANRVPDECEPSDVGDGDGVSDCEDKCPNSDLTATVVINACDTGVDNYLFEYGCSMLDLIEECQAEAPNHGQFVRCVGVLARDWRTLGLITSQERARIIRCVARIQYGPVHTDVMRQTPREDYQK